MTKRSYLQLAQVEPKEAAVEFLRHEAEEVAVDLARVVPEERAVELLRMVPEAVAEAELEKVAGPLVVLGGLVEILPLAALVIGAVAEVAVEFPRHEAAVDEVVLAQALPPEGAVKVPRQETDDDAVALALVAPEEGAVGGLADERSLEEPTRTPLDRKAQARSRCKRARAIR
ncbi:unnamed protein product [Prorocentrum cordatum]|uniref:Uncharacterized protein n=1 Tax=Prorocentrum cordatum TaxID=2364126 RepID=A0ABN9XIR9_9DINO|nr:unnamed protein product [Polarella glacialis]